MTPASELRARFGGELVLDGVPASYLIDATEARGLRGEADAVVLPRTAAEVAEAHAKAAPVVAALSSPPRPAVG